MMTNNNTVALNLENAAECAKQYIETIEPYPEGFRGRGIVTGLPPFSVPGVMRVLVE